MHHASAVGTVLTNPNLHENSLALVAKQASLRQPKTLEGLKHAVRVARTEVKTEEH